MAHLQRLYDSAVIYYYGIENAFSSFSWYFMKINFSRLFYEKADDDANWTKKLIKKVLSILQQKNIILLFPVFCKMRFTFEYLMRMIHNLGFEMYFFQSSPTLYAQQKRTKLVEKVGVYTVL